MRKDTQADKVLAYIRLTSGWIPAYRLVKVELLNKWIGTNGDRIARKLFEEGKIMRKDGSDITGVDAFGKDIERKYTYYHALKPKDFIEYKTADGVVVAKKTIW